MVSSMVQFNLSQPIAMFTSHKQLFNYEINQILNLKLLSWSKYLSVEFIT